jgi:hypothetical protein
VFQAYIDWAYHDLLVLETHKDETMMLTKLGDKLDDVKLRNKATKALTSCSVSDRVGPGTDNIELVWSSTTPNSPRRQWIINNIVMRWPRQAFEEKLAEYPAELVQQVALKLMQQTPPTGTDACKLSCQSSWRWRKVNDLCIIHRRCIFG